MKRIATALLFAAVCLAQTSKDKYMTPGTGGSPPMQTSVTIGGKEIWIVYHAPSVKGRKVFGSADALQKPVQRRALVAAASEHPRATLSTPARGPAGDPSRAD